MRRVITRPFRSIQRNILAGIITIGPLCVTWLIFSFLLRTLIRAGQPLVQIFEQLYPDATLRQQWIQPLLAITLTLLMLYVTGRVTSLVIGRQLFRLFEAILERLPVVAKVYTSVRQLLDSMLAKNDSGQRVVLVDFPVEGQKSIGFLTRTLRDEASGEELASVLLPHAINPTSGNLILLPMSRVVETGLSMEQAMSMILTAGAVGPDALRFHQPEKQEQK